MGKQPIIYSSEYNKDFAMLSRIEQSMVNETMTFFYETRNHPSLRDHSLREVSGIASITVLANLRILYKIRQDGGVLLIRVGNHDRVYQNLSYGYTKTPHERKISPPLLSQYRIRQI